MKADDRERGPGWSNRSTMSLNVGGGGLQKSFKLIYKRLINGFLTSSRVILVGYRKFLTNDICSIDNE